MGLAAPTVGPDANTQHKVDTVNLTPPLRLVAAKEPANELRALARRVERLTVSHRWPEKFFEDKSQLAYELRMLARRVSQR
jgi:hypothetical protein